MNLDDLKAEWRMEMQRTTSADELGFDGIRGQVNELRRGIRFGNFWIVFAFLGISAIEVFAQFVALDRAGWMSKLAAMMWVCLTIWLAVVLRGSVKVDRSDDWTLRSRLEMEIELVQKHRDTWSKLAVWYLAPMMSAIVLSMLGGSHDRTGTYAPGPMGWKLFATLATVFALTYWLGQWEIRRTIDPLLSRLKRLHTELIGSEPADYSRHADGTESQ